jgi:hypothetical protein
MGALLSIAGACVMLAIWHDSATVEEWRRSGGLDETFIDVPLKVVAFGIVGAVLGKAAAKSRPRNLNPLNAHNARPIRHRVDRGESVRSTGRVLR